ncbi:MAG: MFS transporter permease [Coleofasciculus sp. B1-GNL1-01]|uniref:MFS transporter permease n=1 Tax=Coleofasciculus sp. B1-GNL1-01 TaxID=3068484 RepID=UPI0033014EED
MKCIQCQTDNNLKDRTANQGRCKNCGHPFAFEPTTMGQTKITDPFFAKAISDLSVNGSLYFTPQQLYYLINKRIKRKSNNIVLQIFAWILIVIIPYIGIPLLIFACYQISNSANTLRRVRNRNARYLQIIGGFLLLYGILFLLFFTVDGSGGNWLIFCQFAITIIVGMLSFYLGIRQSRRQSTFFQTVSITLSKFQSWLERWQQINGTVEQLLPSPNQKRLPTSINPDITAYSFDRVVVCDSATIAQLLIANNFHFENNCAVLSITGYPQGIFSTVLDMLRRNPELKVYALHNASPHGITLIHNLQTSSNWFADSTVTIYDLGLLPRHVLNSRNLFIQSSPQSAEEAEQLGLEVRLDLSGEEFAWLKSGNFVELESFTPQRLLQIVTQGINRSQISTGGRDSVFIDVESESSSSDVYLVASDSFG